MRLKEHILILKKKRNLKTGRIESINLRRTEEKGKTRCGNTIVISTLERQRQEDQEFETNLGYMSSKLAWATEQDRVSKQKEANKQIHKKGKKNGLVYIRLSSGNSELKFTFSVPSQPPKYSQATII